MSINDYYYLEYMQKSLSALFCCRNTWRFFSSLFTRILLDTDWMDGWFVVLLFFSTSVQFPVRIRRTNMSFKNSNQHTVSHMRVNTWIGFSDSFPRSKYVILFSFYWFKKFCFYFVLRKKFKQIFGRFYLATTTNLPQNIW